MKNGTPLLLFALCVIGLLGCGGQPAAPSFSSNSSSRLGAGSSSRSNLLGDWQITTANGQDVNAIGINIHWKITDHEIVAINGSASGQTLEQTSQYVIDDSYTPHWIDITHAGKKRRGVFEVTSSILRLTTAREGEPRPTYWTDGDALFFKRRTPE